MDKWADKDYASRRAYDAELALTVGGWMFRRNKNVVTLINGAGVAYDYLIERHFTHNEADGVLLCGALRSDVIPHYSTSVDAALTLVPNDVLCDSIQSPDFYECRIGTVTDEFLYAKAETRALAICKAVQRWSNE